MPAPVDELCTTLASTISNAIAGHDEAALFDGLADRLAALTPAREVEPATTSTVHEWLNPAIEAATGPFVDLAQKVLGASANLPWVRSYEHLEPTPELEAFTMRYTFGFLAGPNFRGRTAPLVDDDLLVGFTLQEPNVDYPAHHHDPPELYGIISGTLDWMVGTEWRRVGPGDVIVHRSNESHAMRTGDEPALTFVAWPRDPHSSIYMPSLDPPGTSTEPTRY